MQTTINKTLRLNEEDIKTIILKGVITEPFVGRPEITITVDVNNPSMPVRAVINYTVSQIEKKVQ
jgi:hypothetical protein